MANANENTKVQVSFASGLVANLPKQSTQGTLYCCTDEAIYLGLANGAYHRFGDFISIDNIAALPASGGHTTALYYAIAENVLCKWDGSEWVQINKDTNTSYELVAGTDAGSVKLVGKAKDGTQVSSVELQVVDVEALNNAIKAVQSSVNTLETKIGTLPEGSDTVIAYIDSKTEGIASDEALTTLTDRVTTAEADIDALEESVQGIKGSIGTVTEGKTVVQMIAESEYNDTEVKTSIQTNTNAITAIVNDYLKKADKTELEAAIATAKSEAKSEAVATIMGEAGVDEKYDTLKEVADWILADTTNSAELVAKVNSIYEDYLKGTDKTELEGKIAEVKTLVGTLPEDATSTTVIDYIKEVVDALNIGDYAKAADLTALAGRVATVEATCAGLGALATKDQVSKTEVEATLLAKINQAHTHENADVLAGITATLVEQWNDAYNKTHTHDNADELAKIADGDKAKWDAMEQNAKDYVDDKLVWGTF